jgi:hypothetical protein
MFIYKRLKCITHYLKKKKNMEDGGDLGPQNKAVSTGEAHARCFKHYQNFQSREKKNNKSRENIQC